ncbi:MAG: hypothetical protein IT260_17125 [Saprospiraceae bacterium]|nr:hypothetical protein [Saprospiraceae bacterium]
MKRFASWFFQLFWIAVCALAMVWQTRLLVSAVASDPWFDGFVFGATVFGYNFTAPAARRWVAWTMGLGAGYCFAQLPMAQQLAVLLPAGIWYAYYGLHRPEASGLRRYPVLKPLAVALAWAWVTVWLPLPLLEWTAATGLFVGRAAFIFALALAYDLCDQHYDRTKGLDTLVLQLGVTRSLRLIDAALLLAAGAVLGNVVAGRYSFAAALALGASLLFSPWAIRQLARRPHWGNWRKVLIDTLMLLQFALVAGALLA